jgi:hypothetical protein
MAGEIAASIGVITGHDDASSTLFRSKYYANLADLVWMSKRPSQPILRLAPAPRVFARFRSTT